MNGPHTKNKDKRFLFLAVALLFLWLGSTSDLLSPSSLSSSLSRKNDEPSPKKIVYSTKGPQLTLQEESYNYGKISQEKEVEHQITFISTGNKELIIHNVDTS